MNGNAEENIRKQDVKRLREEKDKKQMNDNDINDSSEDVLSMLKNMSSEESARSSVEEEGDDYYTQFDQGSDMDDTDDDLLALLDMISAQDENSSAVEEESILYTPENTAKVTARNSDIDNEDVHDDILAINEMLANESEDFISSSKSREEQGSKAGDVGDIFSDVLSAVGALEDEPEADLLQGTSKNIFKEIEQDSSKRADKTEQNKKGFFQKLFVKKDEQNSDLAESGTSKKKAAKKEDKKKNKSVKTMPVKQAVQPEDEEERIERERKEAALKIKAEKKTANKEKAALKKAEKAQVQKKKAELKKEKLNQKKAKAEERAKEYIEENPVKLNKLAVIFVMTFFILIGGIVILGTDAYSYSLGVKNANFNFGIKRYNEAYNQIYGLDIRKEDQETYDKIMTVMYVYKQLNSYYNYYQMNEFPEALDSLLKGLERYDKYQERATELGIKEDLEYVKAQIAKELADSFHLSEAEVADLRQKDDQAQYSIKVINTALEKINN